MKRQKQFAHILTAGAFLLTGTLAIAQTAPQTKTRSIPSSTHNPPAGMAVDHAGGNGVRGTAGSHGQPAHSGTTLAGSAQGTTQQKKHLAGVKYQDFKTSRTSGTNPMYEPGDKPNLKPSGGNASSHP